MLDLIQIPSSEAPIDLLLEADPSRASIAEYLDRSECYAAKVKDETVAVCVVAALSNDRVELYNIATRPERQGQGLGGQLLNFALASLQGKGVKYVELGTGTFGHQLSFYQRHGFRVERVIKNHFLANYDEPIFENGIQHKDMLRLVCEF